MTIKSGAWVWFVLAAMSAANAAFWAFSHQDQPWAALGSLAWAAACLGRGIYIYRRNASRVHP